MTLDIYECISENDIVNAKKKRNSSARDVTVSSDPKSSSYPFHLPKTPSILDDLTWSMTRQIRYSIEIDKQSTSVAPIITVDSLDLFASAGNMPRLEGVYIRRPKSCKMVRNSHSDHCTLILVLDDPPCERRIRRFWVLSLGTRGMGGVCFPYLFILFGVDWEGE